LPGYEIHELLGQGGMGVVYKARQRGLDRLVALKLIQLRVDLLGPRREEVRQRFQTEAQAIARLSHPNVVQVFEIGEWQPSNEEPSVPYLSLEYVSGGSLTNRLVNGPLAALPAARLVETLARAVQSAHDRGVVHRDLKPDNVLLTDDGTPKVTDFGLARFLTTPTDGKASGPTEAGAIIGTPSYMAPEQARPGSAEIGPPTDVWALGAILYTCLTGRPPFLAATTVDTLLQVVTEEPVAPGRLNASVPRDLETVALKCLRKESVQRYASAAELADDLERFAQGKPVQARPIGRLVRLSRWARRNPLPAALLFLLLLTLSVGLTAVSLLYGRESRQRMRAEARERQTRELLAGVVGRLTDDPRFRLVGVEPLRKEMASDLLVHVEEYQKLLRNDQGKSTNREWARSERWRGHLGWLAGSAEEAIGILRQAVDKQRRVLPATDPDLAAVVDLARTIEALAFVQLECGQHDAARTSWQEVCTLLDPVPVEEKTMALVLPSLAGAWTNRGLEKGRRGELVKAREYLERARDLWDRLVAVDPQPHWRAGRLNVEVNLGGVALQAGRLEDSIKHYESSRGGYAELVEQQPTMRPYAMALSATCHQLAGAYMTAKRLREAQTVLTQARSVQSALVQTSPDVASWRRYQADHAIILGRLRLKERRSTQAQEAFQEAASTLDEVVPSSQDRSLAAARMRAYTYLGFVQVNNKQRGRGKASFESALAHLKVVGDGSVGMPVRDLGECAYLLASGMRTLGETSRAIPIAEQAAKWQRQVLLRAPNSREVRQELNQTLYELASEQRLLGRHGDAAATARERIALWPRDADQLHDGACELCMSARILTQKKTTLTAEEANQQKAYLDEALVVLKQAVAAGLKGAKQIRADGDFTLLHGRTEFQQLVAEVEKRDASKEPRTK
jgi:tetratricopeptide (TPR) repeat protein